MGSHGQAWDVLCHTYMCRSCMYMRNMSDMGGYGLVIVDISTVVRGKWDMDSTPWGYVGGEQDIPDSPPKGLTHPVQWCTRAPAFLTPQGI